MIRKIITIDEDKCNGCGICADACHEGAIAIEDGKAKLIREDYCDGLGDCLPSCPKNAISFEEREAPAYDAEAVKKNMAAKSKIPFTGCPGMQVKTIGRVENECEKQDIVKTHSRLSNWPVQIKLAPINAPYFNGAKLLIAADCTAYAYASFHEDFLKGRVALIGCPKLDGQSYTEKLTEIIKNNDIREVTILRMEVPCCGGLEEAAKTAIKNSGKFIPWQVRTITLDGEIKED